MWRRTKDAPSSSTIQDHWVNPRASCDTHTRPAVQLAKMSSGQCPRGDGSNNLKKIAGMSIFGSSFDKESEVGERTKLALTQRRNHGRYRS
jgi:hypothetical protein